MPPNCIRSITSPTRRLALHWIRVRADGRHLQPPHCGFIGSRRFNNGGGKTLPRSTQDVVLDDLPDLSANDRPARNERFLVREENRVMGGLVRTRPVGSLNE